MIFITGPLYSGKRTFAQRLPGTRIAEVQALAAEAENLEKLAEELSAYDIVMATEVGGGVVPMDAGERAAREAAGRLACLLAGALALAVLAGCSALMGGTVQKDTEQAKALMKEVDPSLTYNTDLEDAASRLADWLVEDSTQLTTQSGLLTRKVPMTTGSGAMLDTNVYDFIDHSTSFLFLPRGVVIGLAMNNEWGFTGYLYAPPLSEAGSALRSYAAGCTRMGAVFIEYGGETYVVAMFA